MVPSPSRPLTNFGARIYYEAWQEVPEVQPAGLGVELKRLPLVSFCKTADGAHVPLQARRSRARRLRLCAAAGAARTCVARLHPPRPLTRWPSPRRGGPRSPCDDLCAPAECPTSPRSQCQRLRFAQNQHLPLIRWRPGQARWTRAEQHDQNTPSPRCSAPRSVSRSRYTVVSSQFWPRSSRIGFMSQGKETEPSCSTPDQA